MLDPPAFGKILPTNPSVKVLNPWNPLKYRYWSVGVSFSRLLLLNRTMALTLQKHNESSDILASYGRGRRKFTLRYSSSVTTNLGVGFATSQAIPVTLAINFSRKSAAWVRLNDHIWIIHCAIKVFHCLHAVHLSVYRLIVRDFHHAVRLSNSPIILEIRVLFLS